MGEGGEYPWGEEVEGEPVAVSPLPPYTGPHPPPGPVPITLPWSIWNSYPGVGRRRGGLWGAIVGIRGGGGYGTQGSSNPPYPPRAAHPIPQPPTILPPGELPELHSVY